VVDVYDDEDDGKFRVVLTSLLECYITFNLSEPIKFYVIVQTDGTVQRQYDKGKGKVHPSTGTEALYKPYGL
jgi:hypothetical protein